MLSALLLAALAAVLAAEAAPPVETPNDIYRRAAADLAQNVRPEKRRYTRYLSLNAIPLDERAVTRVRFGQANDYVLNNLSFRSELIRSIEEAALRPGEPADLVVIGRDRLLVRLDLEAFGWDRESRIARRAELEKRGVKFAFKDKAAEARFLDPWEDLVRSDVYWKVSQVDAKGNLVRGWIDPVLEEATRKLSHSSSFILRADSVLVKLLTEKERGGVYSEFLMFPDNEPDLYKMFLVPIGAIERSTQLRFGGARAAGGIVAFHNRGLELLPSPYGRGPKFIWRTSDFLEDAKPEHNIYVSLAGTLKQDGREVIGSLPNGFHWSLLFDGKGKQVEVVPQNIAMDMRRNIPDKDRNVINRIKCISCHDEVAGIQPYVDVVGQAILDESLNLNAVSKDAARAAGRAYEVEDYYRIAEKGGLAREIIQQQESYAERHFELNSLTPADNGRLVVGWYDDYVHKLVNLKQAAREIGATEDEAREMLVTSKNSALAVLSSGQPISRSQFEAGYGDVMRKRLYPWERAVDLKVKVGH